jgi:hypothetical protein
VKNFNIVGITYEDKDTLIFMALQTPTHVSLLQKLLGYFDFAAKIGEGIPEPHVQAISSLIDFLITDIEKIRYGAAPMQISAPAPAVPVSDPTLPDTAVLHIAPVVNVETPAVVQPAGEVQQEQVTIALGHTTPFAVDIRIEEKPPFPHDGISPATF